MSPGHRCLSVVVPCYNEAATIRQILSRVAGSPVVHEIIVVDDGSSDGSREILKAMEREWPPEAPPLRPVFHEVNLGKGAALRTGFRKVSGDLCIVQDADLEYDPGEYPKLIQPILDGDADVVYGSRFAGFPRRVLYYWHSLGNRVLTTLSNMATNLNLTDMETCYKAFRSEIIKGLPLRSDRFGFEPEVTAKLGKLGCRIYEVPIAYRGRSYAEGKKIGWKDGIQALWLILKYAFVDDLGADDAITTLRLLRKAGKYNRWVYEMIKPHLGKDILEVGSGIGNMTRHFLPHGTVTATDINPHCLRELGRGFGGNPQVRIRSLDLTAPPSPGDPTHDTIVCLNVLEHVEDDRTALAHLRSRLRPGGRLILYVPANPRLYCDIDRGVGHYRRYVKEDLVSKLAQAGFRLRQVRHHNQIGALGWWIRGCVLRRASISAADVGGFELLMPLVRLQDRIESRFSLSILAVGERPA